MTRTLGALILAVIIVLLERSKKLVSGQSVALMAVAYGISRFIYEFFRAYEIDENGQWHNGAIESVGLTLGQFASLALIGLGVAAFIWRKKAAAEEAKKKAVLEAAKRKKAAAAARKRAAALAAAKKKKAERSSERTRRLDEEYRRKEAERAAAPKPPARSNTNDRSSTDR